jgi:hypothetical protein
MLLNTAETRLSIMVMIARQFLGMEEYTLSEKHLKASLALKSESNDVDRSLMGMKLIGLVDDAEKGDDFLKLSEKSVTAIKEGLNSFVQHVRTQVLASANNTTEWGSQEGARDLTSSLAYYLSLPFSETGSNFAELNNNQIRDFGKREQGRVVRGDEQWLAFYRWTCALGFGWLDLKGKLIPDPTVALLDILPSIFEKKTVLDADVFIEEISKILPVLDGGEYQKFVRENGLKVYEEPPRALSDGLSFALLNLEKKGEISLLDKADAGDKVMEFSSSVRKDKFSEVEYCDE